eukprot:CAMPEP_0171059610 /NCGR_PEP_ID=MMETSP0766_2-20121228/3285_1 /TAXON_ID=439317 /ORGANISM="Gambierdiscus australes, Strain CAWD 149" /LENGTH=250 /DNA_ID=CAMNT_0011515067 /DNA_START=184 /DNA_END=934 /DNA_ORIENTATION=+
MDPITLHFNIFQAGVRTEGKQSLHVDNPCGTTVGSLKRRLFAEALEEQRSVRFITSGHVLDDTTLLGQCGLGNEAFIHVSIGSCELRHTKSPAAPQRSASTSQTTSASAAKGRPCLHEQEDSCMGPFFLLSIVFFIGTGVLLHMAWRRRWLLSLHASQLLCILAAIWVYLLLCHGIPALFQVLLLGLRAVRPSSGLGDFAQGQDPGSMITQREALCTELAKLYRISVAPVLCFSSSSAAPQQPPPQQQPA